MIFLYLFFVIFVGGFVIGCVEFYKPILTTLAFYTGCIVIGIDYRKAPEYKFPKAPEDCLDATRWILQNGTKYGGDTKKICILGDSAGGLILFTLSLSFSSYFFISFACFLSVFCLKR